MYNNLINILIPCTNVIVINNEVLDEPGLSFPETEAVGKDFIANILKLDGTWLQTSYNNNFRFNFAGIGGSYDPENDAFIPVRPYDSWNLNEQTFTWEAPVDYPQDGKEYFWDDRIQNWALIEEV